jgi:acyl-coenzyme A thioesterase PaaI-like protein
VQCADKISTCAGGFSFTVADLCAGYITFVTKQFSREGAIGEKQRRWKALVAGRSDGAAFFISE